MKLITGKDISFEFGYLEDIDNLIPSMVTFGTEKNIVGLDATLIPNTKQAGRDQLIHLSFIVNECPIRDLYEWEKNYLASHEEQAIEMKQALGGRKDRNWAELRLGFVLGCVATLLGMIFFVGCYVITKNRGEIASKLQGMR